MEKRKIHKSRKHLARVSVACITILGLEYSDYFGSP